MPNATPIIISPWKRLLIRLGLKHHTDRHVGSNPYWPEPHPREEDLNKGLCPYGIAEDYLRPRASDLLLRITYVEKTKKGLWRVWFEKVYP